MTKRRLFYLAFSTAVSGLLLYVLLTNISLRDLMRTLEHIFLPGLGVYIAIALCGVWLRALRYRRLLRPEFISWKNIILVTLIRNGFEDLLPARLGSLSYVYVLTKSLNYPVETAASTFVVALTLDLITLSPFLILAFVFVGWGVADIPGFWLVAGSVVYFGLVILLLRKIVSVMNILRKIYGRGLRRLGLERKPMAHRSLDKFRLIIESLERIERRRAYVSFFVLSLAIRLAKYLSLFALLFAILRNSGFAVSWLNFWKTILGISGAELTSFMPLKGLADIGTWASAWTITLRLMKFDLKLAVISGLGVHSITNLFEYTLALASLAFLALTKKHPRPNRSRPSAGV